jgi:antagonist of KipI
MSVRVLRAGFLSTVQDLGRSGFRQFGVSLGGALDAHALRIGNLLAGNEESAAGLEVTFGGLRLQFTDERLVAWCGGELTASIGNTPSPAGHAAFVGPGEELRFDHPKSGCRCWVAISGGIDVPLVLGSRATDLRAGFGGFNGRALRDGDEIALRPHPPRAHRLLDKRDRGRIATWAPPQDWSSPAQRGPILRVTRGADWNRFDTSTLQRLTTEAFTVSHDSDRMGVRFERAALEPVEHVDRLSEAVAPGTIQVPPSGSPILLLGDCQTIGGYAKIGHVITVDLPITAQLRAGDRARFKEVSFAVAHRLLFEREQHLATFRRGLELHFT